MRAMNKHLLGVAIAGSVLALSAAGASAAIACSGDVCWHTHTVYHYPPDARVVIHKDNWHWGPREHFTFREHEGRGYWRGDSWTEF